MKTAAAMSSTVKGIASLVGLVSWAWAPFVTLASGAPGVLFHEDFEGGIGDRWVERGFPSIARKNTFSVPTEPDGNHYLKVESADSYSGKGVSLAFSAGAVPRCAGGGWSPT